MPNAKFIPTADWASAPEVDVTDGENLFPQVQAGTYYPILSSTTSIVVPQLTAGTIDQGSPSEGDTLTVSGSNATGSATYQWQKDGVDISGATSASLDTTGEGTGDYRRGVADGVQTIVYTPAVTVGAAAPSGLATFLGIAQPDSVSGTEYTFSGLTLGTGRIWVCVSILDSAGSFGTGPIQIDGSNATFEEVNADGNAQTLWYRRDVTSATGDIVVDRGQEYDKGVVIRWWRTATSVSKTNAASWAALTSSNINVLDGDHLIAGGGGYITTGDALSETLIGLTEDGTSIDTLTGTSGEASNLWAGSHLVTADETPRTVGATPSTTYAHNSNVALLLRDS